MVITSVRCRECLKELEALDTSRQESRSFSGGFPDSRTAGGLASSNAAAPSGTGPPHAGLQEAQGLPARVSGADGHLIADR